MFKLKFGKTEVICGVLLLILLACLLGNYRTRVQDVTVTEAMENKNNNELEGFVGESEGFKLGDGEVQESDLEEMMKELKMLRAEVKEGNPDMSKYVTKSEQPPASCTVSQAVDKDSYVSKSSLSNQAKCPVPFDFDPSQYVNKASVQKTQCPPPKELDQTKFVLKSSIPPPQKCPACVCPKVKVSAGLCKKCPPPPKCPPPQPCPQIKCPAPKPCPAAPVCPRCPAQKPCAPQVCAPCPQPKDCAPRICPSYPQPTAGPTPTPTCPSATCPTCGITPKPTPVASNHDDNVDQQGDQEIQEIPVISRIRNFFSGEETEQNGLPTPLPTYTMEPEAHPTFTSSGDDPIPMDFKLDEKANNANNSSGSNNSNNGSKGKSCKMTQFNHEFANYGVTGFVN